MRAARLVTLLVLLQTRGPRTGRELADALEVSLRTVYRDIEALNGGGIPIYAERGLRGGFRLAEDFRLHLEILTPEEAEALAVLGQAQAASVLGLERARAAAVLKVGAALPPLQRERLTRGTALISIEVDEPTPQERAHLRALLAAARRSRVVRLRLRGQGTALTEVEPRTVVHGRTGWRLSALREGRVVSIALGDVLGVSSAGRHVAGAAARESGQVRSLP